MSDLSIVISTFPSDFAKQSVIESVISDNLAACVSSVSNITSNYVWEGKLEQSNETLLFFKTKTSLVKKLENRLMELHPYDTPEIISLKSETVNKAYMDWILKECRDKYLS